MPRYAYRRSDKRIEPPEVEMMMLRCASERNRALIAALYLTGARISEVLALQVKNFIFRSNGDIELTINTLKTERKTKKPYQETRRVVFRINTPFLSILVNYVLKIKDAFKYLNTIEMQEKKLFKSMYGTDFKRIDAWKVIKRLNKNISPHAFRHSRCQKLADNGATAVQIKAWTGHKKLDMISQYIENSSRLTEPLKNMID